MAKAKQREETRRRKRRLKRGERAFAAFLAVLPEVHAVPVVPWGLISFIAALVLIIHLFVTAERTNEWEPMFKVACVVYGLIVVCEVAVPIMHRKWSVEQSQEVSGVLHSVHQGWEKGHTPSSAPNSLEIGQSNIWIDVDLPPKSQHEAFLKLINYASLKIEKGETELELTTTVRDHEGAVVAKLEDHNHWTVYAPYCLDKNYTSDSLEVKDKRDHVVLQVRILPDRIQLQGEWNDEYGRGMRVIQHPGGLQFIRWNTPQEAEAEDTEETEIKPWFHYPSKDHWTEWLPKP